MTEPWKNDSLMPMLLLSATISYYDEERLVSEFSSIFSPGFMISRFDVKLKGCDW